MDKINSTKHILALIGISLAAFVAFMDFTIVSAALPAIQVDLHLQITQLEWVMNAFLLFYCVFMASMGRMADLYGRRRILIFAIILFGLGCLVSGLAQNYPLLLLGRALQGIGEASLLPASLALIAILFPQQRGKAIGIWSAISGVGLLMGQGLGGIIVTHLNWHWIFFVSLPIFIIALFLIIFFVSESRAEKGMEMDWIGFLLLTLSIGFLVMGILQGGKWGWLSKESLITLLIAFASSILLIRSEQKINMPLLQFNLFSNRQFMSCALAQFAFVFFNCAALFFIPLYLHYIHGESAAAVGILMMPAPALLILTSPFAGNMLDKYGPLRPIMLGLSCYAISALLQLFFMPDSSYLILILAFVFMGAGWGIILGPTSAAAIDALPVKDAGSAAGVLWTIQVFGGVIGVALTGLFFHVENKRAFLNGLQRANLSLTAKQYNFIGSLLSAPQNANQVWSDFTNPPAKEIFSIFVNSFMQGYRSAMMLLLVIMIISLMVAYRTLRRSNPKKIVAS